MDPQTLKIIGEVIGAIATVEGFFIYYSATRDKMLILKFISDALWCLNLLCLGGYTGALINLVAMGREAVFYNRDKRAFARSPIWPIFFVFACAASPIYSLVSGNEGYYALLPAIGSMLAVVAFYQRVPSRTRLVGFFSQLLWLIYSLFILNYSSAVCNTVLMISAIVGGVREYVRKKRSKGLS